MSRRKRRSDSFTATQAAALEDRTATAGPEKVCPASLRPNKLLLGLSSLALAAWIVFLLILALTAQ